MIKSLDEGVKWRREVPMAMIDLRLDRIECAVNMVIEEHNELVWLLFDRGAGVHVIREHVDLSVVRDPNGVG